MAVSQRCSQHRDPKIMGCATILSPLVCVESFSKWQPMYVVFFPRWTFSLFKLLRVGYILLLKPNGKVVLKISGVLPLLMLMDCSFNVALCRPLWRIIGLQPVSFPVLVEVILAQNVVLSLLTFGRCILLALISGVHGSLKDTMEVFMEIGIWTPQKLQSWGCLCWTGCL
ncbi:hypothetical protein CK203_059944 [Vitis vinifera]|uniref:Uncharacterized protein n=1 Tax=Vitis vinifera TaxID=29760 RepID=A0A438GGJ7_VITVI|nr:hypothetical protein CK203_059944 [Vitis vinifera]